MNELQNDIFLKACRRQSTERTPVWIMRQAGRYLPQYRKVKESVDFLTLCRTPDLVAEVTVQPVDYLGVDAAILFSDILVVPDAMGMPVEMETGAGPVFNDPIRSDADADKLREIDPGAELKYVLDGVTATKKALGGRVPLIGFSGTPWTLLAYMIEGRGTKHFREVKTLIYDNPALAHRILKKLAKVVGDYLSAKIAAGVDAVQLFDSWGGLLSQRAYLEFSLQYIAEVAANIRRDGQPVILFSKGVHHSFERMAALGIDVVSIDYTMDIGNVRRTVADKCALQGNMDPCALFATEEHIREEVVKILESYGEGTGHVFNLGHGILPQTEPERAKFFVDTVKEESGKFHK